MAAQQAMLAFQRALRRWEPKVRRVTHATAVKYELSEGSKLTVTVYWIDRRGTKGKYQKVFERDTVFPRVSAGVLTRPAKRICQFADEIIAGCLQARGL